jgi:hypothetical protein
MRSPRKSQAQQMADFEARYARRYHVEYYMGSKWNWNGGYETLAEAIDSAESFRRSYDRAHRVRDTAAPFMQTIVHEIEGDRNA